ncbi:hypothetical protein HanRHA438_Chr17g0812251 [Helianthus annuus]|nr:hypothetical protein HanRHA438_Chr17g0812251 [Helianthus annuus]
MSSPNSSKKAKKSRLGSKKNSNDTDSISKQELVGLIAEQMADQMARVIPDIVSKIQPSIEQGSVDSKVEPPKEPFLFKQFKACKPLEFIGKDGATALLTWFDAMELTFLQSGCPDKLRTLNATGVFRSRALEWWTTERNTGGGGGMMQPTLYHVFPFTHRSKG